MAEFSNSKDLRIKIHQKPFLFEKRFDLSLFIRDARAFYSFGGAIELAREGPF